MTLSTMIIEILCEKRFDMQINSEMGMKVKIYKNSTGGYTVKWPSLENSGLYHEKHFTPAVGYKCRQEAMRFSKEIQHAN